MFSWLSNTGTLTWLFFPCSRRVINSCQASWMCLIHQIVALTTTALQLYWRSPLRISRQHQPRTVGTIQAQNGSAALLRSSTTQALSGSSLPRVPTWSSLPPSTPWSAKPTPPPRLQHGPPGLWHHPRSSALRLCLGVHLHHIHLNQSSPWFSLASLPRLNHASSLHRLHCGGSGSSSCFPLLLWSLLSPPWLLPPSSPP